MKKNFIIILCLFIIFISIFILNFNPTAKKTSLSPTPTQTSWQTYRDGKNGFEFQYPSHLTIKTDKDRIIISDPSEKFIEAVFDPTQFNKIPYPASAWFKDKIPSKVCIDANCSVQFKTSEVVVSNGLSATLIEYDFGFSFEKNYLIYNPKIGYISFHYGSNDDEVSKVSKIIDTYQKILSTFKFLPSTSSWKTFQSKEINYSLKYPQNWYIATDNLVGTFISNKPISKVTSNFRPAIDQIVIKYLYFSSAFENGLGKLEFTDEKGIRFASDTKYISPNKSFGTTIEYQSSATNLDYLLPIANQIVSSTTILQTYRSQKYGFEFQYPSNLVINKFSNITQFDTEPSNGNAVFGFSINENYSLKQHLSQLEKKYNLKTEKVIFNGLSFTKATYGGDMGENTEYLLEINGNLLSFTSNTSVLSTFKFLPNTSTWKTYSNQKYGLVFKYPSYFLLKEDNNKDNFEFSNSIVLYDTKNKILDPSTKKLVAPNVFKISKRNSLDEVCHPQLCTKKSEIKIGDNTFLPFEEGLGGTYYFSNNFEFYPFLNDINGNNPVYYQILSTVQFISNDTTLKTYKNEKLGFEFQYPEYFSLKDDISANNSEYKLNLVLHDNSKKYETMSGKLEYIDVIWISYINRFSFVCSDMCQKKSPVYFGSNQFIPFYNGGLYQGDEYLTHDHYLIQTRLNPTDPTFVKILSTFKFTK